MWNVSSSFPIWCWLLCCLVESTQCRGLHLHPDSGPGVLPGQLALVTAQLLVPVWALQGHLSTQTCYFFLHLKQQTLLSLESCGKTLQDFSVNCAQCFSTERELCFTLQICWDLLCQQNQKPLFYTSFDLNFSLIKTTVVFSLSLASTYLFFLRNYWVWHVPGEMLQSWAICSLQPNFSL